MRIVSLLPSASEIIARLGLRDQLVGISDECNWPPELAGLPVVSRSRLDGGAMTDAEIDAAATSASAGGESLYEVDSALMAALRPDLVIVQDVCQVCAVSTGDLESVCPAGAQIHSMNPRTLREVVDSISGLGERLGAASAGARLAGEMRSTIEGVRARVAGARRPRVFVAEWIDPPYDSGHWVPEMVEAAGGESIAGRRGEYSAPTTWETVVAARPEVVVVAACGFGIEEARERARQLELPVRTVVVDGDAYFSRPGPRLADGVRQLGHLLHPGLVPDPGLPFWDLGRRGALSQL